MSDMVLANVLSETITDGLKIVAGAQKERARYEHLNAVREVVGAAEEMLPGVELDNYTKREVTESGTHILVVEHKERLEKIPVPVPPPTAEEIAAQREHNLKLAKIWATAGSIAAGALGAFAVAYRVTSTR